MIISMKSWICDKLAGIACMSSYHWHRIYRMVHGETLAATVKRLFAVCIAAGDIVRSISGSGRLLKDPAIPTSSLSTVSSSRSTACRRPVTERGKPQEFQPHPTEGPKPCSTLPTEDRADRAHRAIPAPTCRSAFEVLFGTLHARGPLAEPDKRMIVHFDDPDLVPAEELRSIACVAVDSELTVEAPLEPFTLEGGEYAVLRPAAPYADMYKAYQWLFSEWLPSSGRQLRATGRCSRITLTIRATPPTELVTEIYMPLI